MVCVNDERPFLKVDRESYVANESIHIMIETDYPPRPQLEHDDLGPARAIIWALLASAVAGGLLAALIWWAAS